MRRYGNWDFVVGVRRALLHLCFGPAPPVVSEYVERWQFDARRGNTPTFASVVEVLRLRVVIANLAGVGELSETSVLAGSIGALLMSRSVPSVTLRRLFMFTTSTITTITTILLTWLRFVPTTMLSTISDYFRPRFD